MVALALAGGILGYLYLKHESRQKKIEIVHQERMAAMDKGIPLPEFPLELERRPSESERLVIPILGTVLFSISTGAMIMLAVNPSVPHGFWISPLPLAFMGVGLLAFHLLKDKGAPRR